MMRKLAYLSTAFIVTAGGCTSRESYQDYPMPKTVVPTASENIETPQPSFTQDATGESLVSAEALQRIFDDRLLATQLVYPATNPQLRILGTDETTDCTIEQDVLSFSLQGSDPTVAYNCIDDATIVISEAFVDAHVNNSSDPKNAANILFAHEIAHTVMDSLGMDALAMDKTRGERVADCLAGNTFASLAPEEQSHLADVFSESMQVIAEDVLGREAAFAKGLAGAHCV